jgi:hypothetical protein
MTSARRDRPRSFLSCAAVFLLAAASVSARTLVPELPDGEFRVSRGIAAPWLDAETAAVDTRARLGDAWSITPGRFAVPGLAACNTPRYDRAALPPEGLFQGNLPAPTADAAARLAMTRTPVASVSVSCDAGIFDLHWVTSDALMVAIDNVIWVLDRSPGARAPTDAPGHALQRLLEAHFAGDMGFTPASVATKRAFLAERLQRAISAYFAHPHPEDEPPPINGDPFTDSQEYPVLFSVREATVDGTLARVPVRFDDGHRTRAIQFELVRETEGWRVLDLRYEDGSTLTEALALP